MIRQEIKLHPFISVDSGYNGSVFSPSPSSSRESIDAKSIGSTGSGGNRRVRFLFFKLEVPILSAQRISSLQIV